MDTRNNHPQTNESTRPSAEVFEVGGARHEDVIKAIQNLEKSSFDFSDVKIEYSNVPHATESTVNGTAWLNETVHMEAKPSVETMPAWGLANPLLSKESVPQTSGMGPEQINDIVEAQRKVNEAIAAANPSFEPYDDRSAKFEEPRA